MLISSLLLAVSVIAAPAGQIVLSAATPHSSFSSLSTSDRISFQAHIDSLPELRLVQFEENGPILEITEGEKSLLVFEGKRFMDVTNEDTTSFYASQIQTSFPKKVAYTAKQLTPLFDDISIDNMMAFLTKFSGYRTRYYRSQTGSDSQKWLLSHLKEIALTAGAEIKFTEFVHSWGQNSIIARFEPSLNASDEIVIIAGHLDSTNLLRSLQTTDLSSIAFLAAPGAGDDGSGTTTLVAAFTSLVNANFQPSTNPVEFHFYSAEEGGLLGSKAVAQDYAAKSKPVKSMLQIDMTSWVKSGTKPVFGVITDFVDPHLTEFIKKVITEYAEIDFVETKCGYACSDHASWTAIGVRSAFAIESEFKDSNPHIHSSSDRLDISPEFSFEHIGQFARMAIGLAVELGGGDSLI